MIRPLKSVWLVIVIHSVIRSTHQLRGNIEAYNTIQYNIIQFSRKMSKNVFTLVYSVLYVYEVIKKSLKTKKLDIFY